MRTLFAATLGLAMIAGLLVADEPEKPKLDIRYVPTHPKAVEAMLKLAGVKEGDTVCDLGCGDGRIVIAAVKDFKAKKGIGYDLDPDRLKDCKVNLESAKLTAEQEKAITFKLGNVLKLTPDDFKDIDVVTLYLLPSINDKLQPVLKKGLKPGARVVSHDFSMTDWKEDKMIKVDAPDRTHSVYLWTIPAKN